jgi:hypothetical protein
VSEGRLDRLRRTTQQRATQLEQGRRTGLLMAVGKRFGEIDGGTYGGLMAIELFTTVLPLIILGFGDLSGFGGPVNGRTSAPPSVSRMRSGRHGALSGWQNS